MNRFLDFVRTGALNGVSLGATEAAVRTALGSPDDVSAGEPPIWRYATAEITFRDRKVAMIAVTAQADADAVKKALDDAGARYEPHSELSYDEQVSYVVTGSGVTLTLDLARPLARGFAT